MSFYLMHRGWMDHPVLQERHREPLTRREAWCWLIEHAVFKTTRVRAANQVVEIQRGQLCASLRYLGEVWGWDHLRVRRFLDALHKESMIETASETGQTIITICNYDKFQYGSEDHETANETEMKQRRNSDETNKKEGKEGKEDSESPDGDSGDSDPLPPTKPPDPVKELFDRGLTLLGKKNRSLLAKMCRDFGEVAVMGAIVACEEKGTLVDPLSYFIACCEARAEKSRNARTKRSPVENLYLGGMLAADALDRRDAERAARESGTRGAVTFALLDGGRSG